MSVDKHPYSILAIEDNPGDFVLVTEFLEERIASNIVYHAPDFKTATELLALHHHSLDVILLDLSLPDKSGVDLVTEVLSLAGNLPVIVLTGNADIEFSIRSISFGVSDYLVKDDLTADILYKSIIYSIERKKIIKQLKESEERFSTLFHQSPQPMYVYDPATTKLVQVNKAATVFFGYTAEQMEGMSVMDLVYTDDVPMGKQMAESVLEDTSNSHAEQLRFQKKSGEMVYVELYGTSINLDGKYLRSVIAIDITEKLLFEKKMTRAIIKTQEDERYEIGSELHDNVCQILASSQMYMSMLEPVLQEDTVNLLEQAKGNTGLAIREIRSLSHRLAPAFFDESSLEESMERLINDFSIGDGMLFDCVVSEQIHAIELGHDLQLNLYRILQEQLRNIQKYAQASKVDICVDLEDEALTMMISDNGIGFDINKVKKGIGIANMKRRAELFGGNASISSAPGKGCQVLVSIPLTKPAE
jgi:two-component system, NarL family, sensor histidine kinase UhpB